MSEREIIEESASFSGSELANELEGIASPEDPAPTEYKVLTSFRRGETDAELRRRYLENTDALIASMQEQGTDIAVYLDKSARPVSWMVDEVWDIYAGEARKPETKYANIDREQWQDVVGDYQTEGIDIGKVPEETIDELRALFADPNDPEKSIFDGKRIMIIDEVRTSGATLATANAFFKRAFPKAEEIQAEWWMTPAVRNIVKANTVEVPVWYRQDSELGRGVANRHDEVSANSTSSRQRVGHQFLSTRFAGRDPLSEQLRAEVKQLGKDIRNLEQPIRPSHQRLEPEDMTTFELKALAKWYPQQYAADYCERIETDRA